MKEAIIENLKRVSQLKQYSEQDIVYFFVESCKFLESIDNPSEFNVIKFYRNWCCHSKLNAVLDISKEIEISSERLDKVVCTEFKKYAFKNLKNEIKIFCTKFLDDKIIDFKNFERPLQKIIIDTPLIIMEDGKPRSKEVFRLKVREQLGPNANPPFNDLTFHIKYVANSREISILGGSRQQFLSF